MSQDHAFSTRQQLTNPAFSSFSWPFSLFFFLHGTPRHTVIMMLGFVFILVAFVPQIHASPRYNRANSVQEAPMITPAPEYSRLAKRQLDSPDWGDNQEWWEETCGYIDGKSESPVVAGTGSECYVLTGLYPVWKICASEDATSYFVTTADYLAQSCRIPWGCRDNHGCTSNLCGFTFIDSADYTLEWYAELRPRLIL